MTQAMQLRYMAQANKVAHPEDATHIAIQSGPWSDPSTWSCNEVPQDEAFALIPDHITVKYDLESDIALKTVRVDGGLIWATDRTTEMFVETIVTTPGSVFEIGTVDKPVRADVRATITFRDTPIDRSNDPDQIGHGLIAYGKVTLQGAMKNSYVMVAGSANRGDRTVGAMESLDHWAVGDTVVIVGIGCGNPDEERKIAAINDDQITFDRPLNYNHDLLRGMSVGTYVGNLTRNLTLRSEDADGVRGHVMLMNTDPGTDGVANRVRFAAFQDLGRTDTFIDTGTATNPNGRYPLNLHEMGTGDKAPLTVVAGSAINGSLGWGIVHNGSHAHIHKNVVYDTVGAGIIAHKGNETGEWTHNFVTVVDETIRPVTAHSHPTVGASGFVRHNQLPEPAAPAPFVLSEPEPSAKDSMISVIEEFAIEDGDVLDLIDVADNFGLNAMEMEAALRLADVAGGVRVSLAIGLDQHDLVIIRGVTAAVLQAASPWVFEEAATVAAAADKSVLHDQIAETVPAPRHDEVFMADHDDHAIFGGAGPDAFIFQSSPAVAEEGRLPVLQLSQAERSRPTQPADADEEQATSAHARRVNNADPLYS